MSGAVSLHPHSVMFKSWKVRLEVKQIHLLIHIFALFSPFYSCFIVPSTVCGAQLRTSVTHISAGICSIPVAAETASAAQSVCAAVHNENKKS